MFRNVLFYIIQRCSIPSLEIPDLFYNNVDYLKEIQKQLRTLRNENEGDMQLSRVIEANYPRISWTLLMVY